MAIGSINLYIDADRGRLVQAFDSTLDASLPRFVFGDKIPVAARVLIADSSASGRPYREADLNGKTIRVGIGAPGSKPVSGTFTLLFDGEETDPIDYNASAEEIQTALNALDSISGDGSVVVTGSAATSFRVQFESLGATPLLEANTGGLYPLSSAFVGNVREGDEETKAIQIIRLESQPVAYAELSDDLPSAAGLVTVVREGATGLSEIQSIELSPQPYDGTFSIEIADGQTDAISYNATAAELQSALELIEGIGVGNVTVTGSFPRWTITLAAELGSVGAATVDAAGLIVPTGKAGELSTNTAGVIELLSGAASVAARFEVEIYDFGESAAYTAVQTDCTILEDVISNEPASQPGMPEYATVEQMEYAIENSVVTIEVNNAYVAEHASFGSVALPQAASIRLIFVETITTPTNYVFGGTELSAIDEAGGNDLQMLYLTSSIVDASGSTLGSFYASFTSSGSFIVARRINDSVSVVLAAKDMSY